MSFANFAETLPRLEVTRTARGVETKTIYYLDSLISNGDKYAGGKFTPGDTSCYGNSLTQSYNNRVTNVIKEYVSKGYSISAILNMLPDFVLSGCATVKVLNESETINQISSDDIKNEIKGLIPNLVKENAEAYANQLCQRYEIEEKVNITASF